MNVIKLSYLTTDELINRLDESSDPVVTELVSRLEQYSTASTTASRQLCAASEQADRVDTALAQLRALIAQADRALYIVV